MSHSTEKLFEVNNSSMESYVCKDGQIRDFGGIRFDRSITQFKLNISTDILSVSCCSSDSSTISCGINPFLTSQEYSNCVYVCKRQDETEKFHNTLWITQPTNTNPDIIHLKQDDTQISPSFLDHLNYSIREVERKPSENEIVFELLDQTNTIQQVFDRGSIQFYLIPDKVLQKLLIENGYKTELLSEMI